MTRLRLFLSWYKTLRQQKYTRYNCLVSAMYNSKYYDTNGKQL